MPTAGIHWTKDSIPAVCKILIHEWWCKELSRRGIDEMDVRDKYERFPPIVNRQHFHKFTDYVDHMLPEFKPYFKAHTTERRYGYPRVITDRATKSIVNGEIERFRWPVWKPIHSMVMSAIETGKPIDTRMRYEAHETMVRLETKNLPGVYLNVDPSLNGWFRLGSAGNVVSRNDSHRSSSHMVMVRVYVTHDKQAALDLERSLFNKLKFMKVVVDQRFKDNPLATAGPLRMRDGIDPVDCLDKIVRTHYSEFCRATGI